MASFTHLGTVETLHVNKISVIEAQGKLVKIFTEVFYNQYVVEILRKGTDYLIIIVETINLFKGYWWAFH